MRNIIFVLFLFMPYLSPSQVEDSLFIKQMNDLNYLIQSNLPAEEDQYLAKTSEYFIYDLTFDSKANLIVVDILCKENSVNIPLIRKIKEAITKNWKPQKIKYSKILLPLILAFFTTEESASNNISGSLAINELFKHESKG